METELTKKLKVLTHYFRPRMSITTRSIRWADEVWTPTGIVDSIRFEDYHVDNEIVCRLIDANMFSEHLRMIWSREFPMGKCFRDGSTDKDANKCRCCLYKTVSEVIGMMITCFEVKITYSDFRNANGHNFHGNENYYVAPAKLAKRIVDEVPPDIGVIGYHDSGSMRIVKPSGWRNVPDDVKILLLYNAFKKWVDKATYPGIAEIYATMPEWVDADELNLLNEPRIDE